MTNLEFYKEEIKKEFKTARFKDALAYAYRKQHNVSALLNVDDCSLIDWLCEEHQILAKEEKEYLSNVIEPFRNKVIHISKYNTPNDTEYITIAYRTIRGGNNSVFTLPEFESGIMYKCLELNKLYTLAELGLEKVEVKEYDY